MKTQKLLIVLASAALGPAGCGGNVDASAPTYKVPTISQMDKEKQVLMAECKEKAAKDYAAKVKAEKEAQAKAEAAAQAGAGVQSQGGVGPQGGTQARSGGSYQGRSNYQAPRRSGGNSGGGSGVNNWPDHLEIEMPVAQEGEPDPCRWVDTDGNRWTTDHC
ncbi:hypothetical protein [uncultured Varibaculum sp.]|uniref:hypothetical protein n=1 Tax=uncultured Varibaculum sp. TaxID=413896 RepID=UPI0025870A47|nr:hypothetical protein [uncultured Varibaculum sp.]